MGNIWEDQPDLFERLKELLEQGRSSSQIARALGNGITRNSVIGKVNRTHLRPPTAAKNRQINRQPPKKKPKPVIPIIPKDMEEPVPLVDDTGKPITVLNARDSHCRWPHGDLTMGTFRYCGKVKAHGCFCDYHAVKAYQPAPKREEAA